jgi:neutral ceramidase
LISGDNKGYASYRFEHDVKKSGFVAGFAQTNCGDVTPNLNLNNTGPGKDDTESTAIIGERQFVEAKQLFDQAGEKLEGPIDYRHTFVDFSKTVVAGEFTGQGDQPLWPSAFGYAFAAGSTEDGGGHPLFKEGMKERNALIDGIIRAAARPPEPGENFRDGHKPKVILLATGLYRPPMQEQVLPLGLVRVGSMVWVVGPCEYTTMAGRRIREAVAKELGVEPQRVIIAGYANDFAGYVTTYEEYQTQQYEGGHTLFGPWTEAAHRQEFVKLARAMAKGETVTPQAQPVDMRPFAKSTWSEGPVEKDPPEAKFGDVAVAPAQKVKADDEVSLAFWTGRPSNDYRRQDRFFTIERETAPGKWEPVIRDGDWGATCRWLQVIEKKEGDAKEKKPEAYSFALTGLKLKPDPYQMTVRWLTKDAAPGTYRVVHFGRVKREQGVERFTSTSPSFQIIAD